MVTRLDRLIRHRAGESDICGTRAARRAGTQTCNESGWIWLRAANGRPGWIPGDTAEAFALSPRLCCSRARGPALVASP